ncbi:aminotransferase class IV [Adhaeribacter swui]|uniref:branched-chain-amino-acid transaminase n=1 Tax=Adhaeribacter swui TaxID=2086471 RepID=A0A7G7GDG5_9BACT|nr:aminotransferase class IV [Adhaeribacter swui]QNF35199.1 aminotransferase class IV [Adhaeribacter swui]
MHLLYNLQLLAEENFKISFNNRAFQYNDGLFDTLIVEQGKIRFLADHLERIMQAMQLLKMQVPAEFQNLNLLEERISELAAVNQLQDKLARAKIHVWRAPGGLFTPEQNQAESLITVQEQPVISAFIPQAGFAASVQNQYSSLSFFKGPFATQYVLASLEKKERQLDELILITPQGFVSEVLVANIFWIRNNVVYTPALQTGCIAGIIRKNILKLAVTQNIDIQEGLYPVSELMQADFVFTSNVTGLRTIQQIQEKQFAHQHTIHDKLNQLLFSGSGKW